MCPAGWWTISWGAVRDSKGEPVTATASPVSEDEAEALLRRDDGSSARHACNREFLACTADDLAILLTGSAIEQILADYQVNLDQARAYHQSVP